MTLPHMWQQVRVKFKMVEVYENQPYDSAARKPECLVRNMQKMKVLNIHMHIHLILFGTIDIAPVQTSTK